MSTKLLALLCLLLCLGCDGSKIPSHGKIYRVARKAAMEQAGLPRDISVRPMDEAVFSIGKNAARVDLAYEHPSQLPAGIGYHSICLKRVARRWEFERGYPTPHFEE